MNTPKKKTYSYPKTWELTKPHGEQNIKKKLFIYFNKFSIFKVSKFFLFLFLFSLIKELIINEYKEKQKDDEDFNNTKDHTESSLLIESETSKILKEDSEITFTEPEHENSNLSLKENKKILINNSNKEYIIKPKKRSFSYSNSKEQIEPYNKMPRTNKIK